MDGWRFVCRNQDDVPLDEEFIESLTKMHIRDGEEDVVIPSLNHTHLHIIDDDRHPDSVGILVRGNEKTIRLRDFYNEYIYEQFIATLDNIRYNRGNFVHPDKFLQRFGKTKSARNA